MEAISAIAVGPQAVTTVGDLATIVRRTLGDFPRTVVDTIPSYDGVTNPINTGRDLPIENSSETITVNGVAQTRGVDYSIDYDARQTTWINVPAAGASLRLRYKECVYKTDQVYEALNQGRRMLFPGIYQKDMATVSVRNMVRDYDLATIDCNESVMRSAFSEGHLYYKILRATYLPLGNVDQSYRPFRNFWQEGESGIHIWEMLPAGYTLRIEAAFAFSPFTTAAQTVTIPDLAQSLVTEWAISMLALKQEPIRGRIDTAAVTQASFANPAGTMAQTSEDFARRVRELRTHLNMEPLVVETRNIPHRWELGAR